MHCVVSTTSRIKLRLIKNIWTTVVIKTKLDLCEQNNFICFICSQQGKKGFTLHAPICKTQQMKHSQHMKHLWEVSGLFHLLKVFHLSNKSVSFVVFHLFVSRTYLLFPSALPIMSFLPGHSLESRSPAPIFYFHLPRTLLTVAPPLS